MLEAARKRFAAESSVCVLAHNLDEPLPVLGKFDAVISSFAIHHLVARTQAVALRRDLRLLNPGGVFCNLEHVASADTAAAQRVPGAHRIHGRNRRSIEQVVRLSKPNSDGCARLASRMWTATGNGGNWRCWPEGGGKIRA